MINLTIVTSYEEGGVLTYVQNLTKYLDEITQEYKLIYYKRSLKLNHKAIIKGNTTWLHYSQFASKYSILKFINKYVKDNQFYYWHDTLFGEVLNYYNREVLSVFVMHGDIKHYQHFLRELGNSFDEMFCVSHGLKAKYVTKYPQYSLNVLHPLVPNFTLNLGLNKPAVQLECCFIGRLEYLKGADTLIKILRAFKDSLNVKFTFYIPTQKNETLFLNEAKKYAKIKMGLTNVEVISDLKRMDLLLFPSRSEGFGMAILEAMNYGIPSLVRNLKIGIPDLVVDGLSGVTCEKDIDFIECLDEFIQDRRKLNNLRASSLEFARQNFNFEIKGAQMLNELDKVVKRKDKSFTISRINKPHYEAVHRGIAFFKYIIRSLLNSTSIFISNVVN